MINRIKKLKLKLDLNAKELIEALGMGQATFYKVMGIEGYYENRLNKADKRRLERRVKNLFKMGADGYQAERGRV